VIREADALSGKAIEIGSLEKLLAIAGKVAVAEIVGENENDIWTHRGFLRIKAGAEENQDEQGLHEKRGYDSQQAGAIREVADRGKMPAGMGVLWWMFRYVMIHAWAVAAAAAATPDEEIAAKVPAARAILDRWTSENPEVGERVLHIVLWTPADRDPAPRFRERLSGVLHDVRDFYASEMERLGFGPRTLRFQHDDDGLIHIHVVKGRQPYAEYQVDSGAKIRTECLPTLRAAGIDADAETILIFCNMSNWDEDKLTINQNSPYYAGGTHRNGTAWQVDSAILDVALLDKKEPVVQDGQYGKISIGKYNSIFIGGVCHEIGHALGLPHVRERADERAAFGTALMGSGNRTYGDERRGEGSGSFLTLAHGLRLAAHPVFSGSVKAIDARPNAVPSELELSVEGNGIRVQGKVAGDPPVYGVVAYMDPEGGSDYDATSATAVPEPDGSFTLSCNSLVAGKRGELRLVFLQANGVASGFLSATPYRYNYVVDKDGNLDIGEAMLKRSAEKLELPDPLRAGGGRTIRNFEEWERTGRPRTLEAFRKYVYGRMPIGKPGDFAATVLEEDGNALEGQATIRKMSLTFSGPGGKGELNPIIALPNGVNGPVPTFILICNRSEELMDPRNDNGFWPVREIIGRGYAAVAIHVGDMRADDGSTLTAGIQEIFPSEAPEGESWGAIAAWGWGASRVLDYLEAEPRVDSKRVAVIGHSRGGKAALWCGAEDPRFALVISNNSGCTGAALARRKQGERVKDINDRFPHWFCQRYWEFNDREDELPVDQHQLIGLIAPRLVYVASATDDAWADPQGEFEACLHASPVYALGGYETLGAHTFPAPGVPLHDGRIGYHLRAGKHDLTLEDWKHYLDFAKKHWQDRGSSE
jgi:dienelactone hydrolase